KRRAKGLRTDCDALVDHREEPLEAPGVAVADRAARDAEDVTRASRGAANEAMLVDRDLLGARQGLHAGIDIGQADKQPEVQVASGSDKAPVKGLVALDQGSELPG